MDNGFLFNPHQLPVADKPNRIISLVPSQTELLADLHLDKEVVGITKFCVRPKKWFKEKKHIGGTKGVHIQEMAAMKPDLILANKEENVKERIEALATVCPVYVSDVANVTDALAMIKDVGRLTRRPETAGQIVDKIADDINILKAQNWPPVKTAYFIWKKPWMSIGGDTFIHEILTLAGFDNVFKPASRYPEFNLSSLEEKNPEVILLSSEPFPFKEKHKKELEQHFPNTKICLVDGQMFSWYGSRMMAFKDYLINLRQSIS